MSLIIKLTTNETGIIIAECPAIPGCVPQGHTEAEALAKVREAIEVCAEARTKNGMPLTVKLL